ncbi:gamma-glutamyltransferase family protein [Antarcticimicrobium luteum]|uniref:Gamma-glutamyltransferase family protein n=1 Tax=Antarcticimicrobium luteum TaxID=2547397 RepID=A0A4R5VAN1_9RHOB|nr:gamma-glutamyltransferase family protein [Antarcticimicrobium luteum]TDK48696.1 gamma-glutamyltransferase family protein [Antarcticimicrobium luteum]
MAAFTTRPEITGTFGVATSTHWLASSVGFGLLEKGGNAFDAAVAMGFVLQVVEPHLNGPGGEVPAIVYSAKEDKVKVLCGQGSAPQGATIAKYRDEGLDLIPGSGLLATVIPGAFDGWMLMLRDQGTMSLREVLEPAIYYARQGHPVLERVSLAIESLGELFEQEWPTSAETWMPGGKAPATGRLFRNPALADTWERLLTEAETVSGREAQIDKARDAFYRGFIAEAIGGYLKDACVMDGTGERRKGVLSADDLAGWHAHWEEPLTLDYGDWAVCKTAPWSQGPVLLQSLQLLKHAGIADMPLMGADFIHTVIEAMKLSYADREAYYGDPDFFDIPMERLLSDDYAAGRSKLITGAASLEQRPGVLPGLEHLARAAIDRAGASAGVSVGADAGEPTMAHLSNRRGDTVHVDVIDRWGNMVSATPSGGWLQSSPIIPGLGFALNSRAQMFWLDEGLPTSLAPGHRPRTTLTPSLALRDGRPHLAFGTPGGDQQDQWQLIFFLRLVHGQQNMQEVIDAPLFHSEHFTGSFYPRVANPGRMMIEPSAGAEVIAELRGRGHDVNVSEPWAIGRLTAAARDADGLLRAAATPRLMQAYAVGR